MVIQFENFKVTSNFEIRYTLLRLLNSRKYEFRLCAQLSVWTHTTIPHKMWGARRTDMNMDFMLPAVTWVIDSPVSPTQESPFFYWCSWNCQARKVKVVDPIVNTAMYCHQCIPSTKYRTWHTLKDSVKTK